MNNEENEKAALERKLAERRQQAEARVRRELQRPHGRLGVKAKARIERYARTLRAQ